MGFGFGLPKADYIPGDSSEENMAAKQADIDDNFWRFIYLFPLLVNTFMLVSFKLFIK
jgi:hypothetical protein